MPTITARCLTLTAQAVAVAVLAVALLAAAVLALAASPSGSRSVDRPVAAQGPDSDHGPDFRDITPAPGPVLWA